MSLRSKKTASRGDGVKPTWENSEHQIRILSCFSSSLFQCLCSLAVMLNYLLNSRKEPTAMYTEATFPLQSRSSMTPLCRRPSCQMTTTLVIYDIRPETALTSSVSWAWRWCSRLRFIYSTIFCYILHRFSSGWVSRLSLSFFLLGCLVKPKDGATRYKEGFRKSKDALRSQPVSDKALTCPTLLVFQSASRSHDQVRLSETLRRGSFVARTPTPCLSKEGA